jgi:hypothetical protein
LNAHGELDQPMFGRHSVSGLSNDAPAASGQMPPLTVLSIRALHARQRASAPSSVTTGMAVNGHQRPHDALCLPVPDYVVRMDGLMEAEYTVVPDFTWFSSGANSLKLHAQLSQTFLSRNMIGTGH